MKVVMLALLVACVLFSRKGATQEDAAPAAVAALERDYQAAIRPLLARYCFECHADDVTEADVDLGGFGTIADVRRQTKVWLKVGEMLDSGQMPPTDAQQPNHEDRTRLRTWVNAFLANEAQAQSGDPGPVLLRRLSNAEYTYTIRDLAGVDVLDPAREFPVDGAAGEGFTNTGSGQGMSPALVEKYLDAAKAVAAHAVLLPDGITFSPHTTRRDQTDEQVGRIQTFYRQFTADGGGQPVNLQGIQFDTNQGGLLPLEGYLAATLEERDALCSGNKTIEAVAGQRLLNAKYLATLWQALAGDSRFSLREKSGRDVRGANNDNPPSPLMDELREKWARAKPEDAKKLADDIAETQMVLWKFNSIGHIGPDGKPKTWMEAVTPVASPSEISLKVPQSDDDVAISPVAADGSDGSEAHQRAEAAYAEFRNLFPPALCYARIVPVDEVVTLTLFYRQDDHLQRLMLNDDQIAELDRMWDQLFYVAQEPLKYQVAFEQIREFATQDRPDLVKTWAPLVKSVDDRADAFRKRLVDTESVHVRALLEFADRAWRRKLTDEEKNSLRDLYQTLRDADLSHEEAIRLTMARILSSPAFLYRREKPARGDQPAPVSDIELASRLSYFLWSSMPDAELRRVVEASRSGRSRERSADSISDLPYGNGLNEDSELVSQTRRMLKDPRTRRLAVEFACQWLHVRNFDQTVEKNEKLYPEFTELRDDMYEETLRFFEDLFRNDRSILSILDADHTFVNEAIAKHYGINWTDTNPKRQRGSADNLLFALRAPTERDGWKRVDGVGAHGRGGVLGMATVLASQSGASRTSPILRGNWIYETLLGERLPRPPAGVPQLPDQPPEGLTERELTERHSSVAACAKCHAKIDPYGFALEQYDAIGRLLPTAVDTNTKLFDGKTVDGIDGLRSYLMNERRDDFVRQFTRKLLGYALGREVQFSDRPLMDKMMSQLAENDYRFSVAVEAIVLSSQFRMIRGASFNP